MFEQIPQHLAFIAVNVRETTSLRTDGGLMGCFGLPDWDWEHA